MISGGRLSTRSMLSLARRAAKVREVLRWPLLRRGIALEAGDAAVVLAIEALDETITAVLGRRYYRDELAARAPGPPPAAPAPAVPVLEPLDEGFA